MRKILAIWVLVSTTLAGCGSGQEKIDPFADITDGKKKQRSIKECPGGYDPMQFRTDPGKRLPGGLTELADGAYRVTSEEFLITQTDRRRVANTHYRNGAFPCTNLGAGDRWGMELGGPVSWRKQAKTETSILRNYQFSFDGTSPLLVKLDGVSSEGHDLATSLRFYDDVRLYEVEVGAEWELRVVKTLEFGPRAVLVQGAFKIRH